MSIQSELNRLEEVRNALVESVNNKSGSLATDATLWQIKKAIDDMQMSTGSGFELAKITQYTPYRAELTAVDTVVISNMGSIESQYGDTQDFTDINGTYVVTEATKYLTGLKRIYKQQNGNYYICGYDPSDYEYPDWDAYWCITRGTSPNRWDSKAVYDNKDIPNGTNAWYNDFLGSVSITTEVRIETYPLQQLLLTGVGVKEYDLVKRKFSFSNSTISLSGFEKPPTLNGVYALVQKKIIGNMISYVDDFAGGATVFAIEAAQGIKDLIGGGSPTIFGDGQEVLRDGEFCFDHSRALDYAVGAKLSGLKDFTIEMDYTITSDNTGYCGFFGNRSGWTSMCICMQWGRNGYRPTLHWNDYFDGLTGGNSHPEWINDGKYHHVALVRSGNLFTMYSDGVAIARQSGVTLDLNLAVEQKLCVGAQHVENAILPGRMKHFRVCNSAIYTENFDNYLPYWVGGIV